MASSTKPQPQDLGPLATVPMAGNSGVPSTPAAGLGQIYGIGTSNINLGFMNESGTAINITGGLGAWTSYTPTFGGFSAAPTGYVARYIQIGKTVIVNVIMPSTGTSNATTFTVSAPVTAMTLTNNKWFTSAEISDNSTTQAALGIAQITSGSATINLYKDNSAPPWTASGGKSANFVLTYEAA